MDRWKVAFTAARRKAQKVSASRPDQFRLEYVELNAPSRVSELCSALSPASEAVVGPSREEAEAAVRTLIRWAGDNPDREGLKDTPARVTRAFRQLYSGYGECPTGVLDKKF